MKISESTEVKLDLKTIVSVILITASFVGMYYTLQQDIEEAKKLPPAEIQRLEYDLKEEWNSEHITALEERVERLEQVEDVLFEEINILSTLIQEGTENDGKMYELNKRLEELQNKEAVSKFSSPLSGKNLPFSKLSEKLSDKKKKDDE